MSEMNWLATEPGVWRSDDGRYAIVAQTLPEKPPRTVYQARKVDEAMASAYPERGDLGYLLEESPWCWNEDNSVHSAEAVIERDAFTSAHDTSVPEDHPAAALSRFWWPISKGTSRGALAVTVRDGEVVAQVLGMTRRDDTTAARQDALPGGTRVHPGEHVHPEPLRWPHGAAVQDMHACEGDGVARGPSARRRDRNPVRALA
jgi:hypothetical protein